MHKYIGRLEKWRNAAEERNVIKGYENGRSEMKGRKTYSNDDRTSELKERDSNERKNKDIKRLKMKEFIIIMYIYIYGYAVTIQQKMILKIVMKMFSVMVSWLRISVETGPNACTSTTLATATFLTSAMQPW